ncbi:diacylglycerol kinase [Clostridium thermosuccinogenes]|jgi:diacylglycerol kinase|uniref:Diacylglycerol kinase n=1 Tax=Clostridium thermosuccinogenes TaxID=84032 RepID=A0A2K2F2C7_9CLOT|nr:diacylglycerol kinase family protein [Pseudoclostridium thermosuccinogenes]AUS96389.1 diacylglycerol kinase [Pseudoclostridium thermosuccinogenes]PNT92945.1 diacylglycerol kinase [Pseudoclostridium thermosuccinogenes]PNT95661.1 diacylglycerol kinase [Pseudoclostridium thermosuccinogenes]PNT96884.1 diacylglycerol kinase [Pseudoclostridium thermosuccinogenes]
MKNKRIADSFKNAINGIVYAVRNERNLKIHMTAGICVMLLGLYYRIEKTEFLILCITVALVIVCELLNTGIEALVDIIVDVYHPKAKIIKDVAAGAVLLSAVMSLVVGYVIFFNRVIEDVKALIERVILH